MDKILNRGAFQDPLVNGGNEYEKWDLRTGLADGAVRVIIQSYTEINENIASFTALLSSISPSEKTATTKC